MKNKSITIECVVDEIGISRIYLGSQNTPWSGGLWFYIKDQDFTKWLEKLAKYDGREENKVFFEVGNSDGSAPYHVRIDIYPNHPSGRSTISVKLIEFQDKKPESISEFKIDTHPQEIIDFAEFLKRNFTNKTREEYLFHQ